MADHRGQCWRKHAWMARPLWRDVPSAQAYWDLMYQGGTAISLTTLTIEGIDQKWENDGFEPLEIRGFPTVWDTCPVFLPQAQAKYRHTNPQILGLSWPDHSPMDVTEGYDVHAQHSNIWCGPFIFWDGELWEEREWSQVNGVTFSLFPDGRFLEEDPYQIVQNRVMEAPWQVLNVDYTDTDLVNAVNDDIDYVRDQILHTMISDDPFEVAEYVTEAARLWTTIPAIDLLLRQQARDWKHMLEGRDDPCSSSQLRALQLEALAS